MRATYIGGILLALVIAGVAGFLLFKPQEAPQSNTEEKPAQDSSGPTIPLSTRDGRAVVVPDFTLNKPRVVIEESGLTFVYATQNAEGVEEDPSYGIVYSSESTFIVALFTEPLREARTKAEARLRSMLSLPDNILCMLPISVSVPDTMGPMYKGKDLGLSFCPGAVALP